MACADDIKKQMSYRGRNAASARLNRLYKQGCWTGTNWATRSITNMMLARRPIR